MNRDFLNDIRFKKKVKLEKPMPKDVEKWLDDVGNERRNRIFAKLLRLLYFIIILFALWFGGKYAVESFVSFCRGTEHMEMREIKEDFKDYMENR